MNIDILKITLASPGLIKPYPGNPRTHTSNQVRQIADSIKRFGFTNPILVDDHGVILAGHGRLAAAQVLGLEQVPTIRLSRLSASERRAYVLADNKLAENAGWDLELLAIELGALAELEFDLSLTGFSTAEIDIVLDGAAAASNDHDDALDDVLQTGGPTVTRGGDLWLLGHHKLLCGNALAADDLDRLMDGQTADLLFTDPPYNVPIEGHVCGLGKVHHREFAMASGEMSSSEFTSFLEVALKNASDRMRSGAIAYVCMDWRHMRELLDAGERAFSELKNLCVWNKMNGGMGAFYRSKHELVFVFKKGTTPHVNNFGLGENGRYRTNVWDYPGISSRGAARDSELAMHPTVKPAALIADALRDCSNRGDIILDPFAGSGSTLVAAQSTGRRSRLAEIDPQYCDTIIRRFTALTSLEVVHGETGETFEETETSRFKEGVAA